MKTIVLTTLIATLSSSTAFADEQKSNPFTGKSAAIEQRMLVLESTKVESAIANENLAIAKATIDQRRLSMPEPRATNSFAPTGDNNANTSPARLAAPKKLKPLPKSEMPATSLAPSNFQQPIRPQPPRLVGTVETSAGWLAMIYVPTLNRVLNIADGNSVEGFTASSIGATTATINGEQMKLASNAGKMIAEVKTAPTPIQTASVSVVPSQTTNLPTTPPMDLSSSR